MVDELNERPAFALPGARPHYGPDKLVAVEHIDLHLTPDFATESLDGICTMTVRALDMPVRLLTLDAVEISKSLGSSGWRRVPKNAARRDLLRAAGSWTSNSSRPSPPAR